MASGPQQLAVDFEQVKKQLLLYPSIKIIETVGDPPDRYDIEYSVKGYKLNNDGTVVPSNNHKVSITLPFGYPHFPPTVKPLTPIFHPDIDPDAIRIADFWQENKSLAELIIHIGKMICGISYQKDEPFNQKAFKWYEKRADWLPFDTLEAKEAVDKNITETEKKASLEPGEHGTSSARPDNSLDILKEDLSFPFDEEESEDIDLSLFDDENQSGVFDLTSESAFDDESEAGEINIDLFTDEQEEDDDITLDFGVEEDPGTPGESEELLNLTGDVEEKQPVKASDPEELSDSEKGSEQEEDLDDLIFNFDLDGDSQGKSDGEELLDLAGDAEKEELENPDITGEVTDEEGEFDGLGFDFDLEGDSQAAGEGEELLDLAGDAEEEEQENLDTTGEVTDEEDEFNGLEFDFDLEGDSQATSEGEELLDLAGDAEEEEQENLETTGEVTDEEDEFNGLEFDFDLKGDTPSTGEGEELLDLAGDAEEEKQQNLETTGEVTDEEDEFGGLEFDFDLEGDSQATSESEELLNLAGDTEEDEQVDLGPIAEITDEEEETNDLEFDFDLEGDSQATSEGEELSDLDGDAKEKSSEISIELDDLDDLENHDEQQDDLNIPLDLIGEDTEITSEEEETSPTTVEENEDLIAEKKLREEFSSGLGTEDFALNLDELSPEESEEFESDLTVSGEQDESIGDISLAGLELDDELQENSASASGKARSIRPLIEQKKMFTAKKVLADVPDPSSIEDLEGLEDQISRAIAKAENLYKKADKLEQAGELEKAGLTLDLVANETVDYPGLEFARNRIRDSLLAKDSSEDSKPADDKETAEKGKKKKKKTGRSFKIPYKVIAVVVIFLGILAAATWVTIQDSNNIKLAYLSFQKAEQLLEKKEFKQAKTALDESSTALMKIIALQKDEKEKLNSKIAAIANSKNFKEGLQGRVLYDGKYVTVEMAKNIDKFNSLMADAEANENSGNIDEAIKYYDQAAAKANQIAFEEEEKAILQTMNSLQLKKALSEARKAEEEQEWEQAANTYTKALELSNSLSTSSDTADIETRLAAASFRHELVEGQRAFTASEWEKTIEMLQSAEQILQKNPQIASETEKEEIRKLLIYSRLYHILSGAKNAFEKKEWELAVNQYKNAVYLLKDNKNILGEKAEISIQKIDKTILMTEISREQNRNSLAVTNNNLQTSLDCYREIASLIENSSFKDDETLNKIYQDANSQIAVLQNEIKINSRIDWLKENYEEIFRSIYPSAKSSELLNPQVKFIREEGEKLIFNMSCVEKSQGRAFRLELNYQYDQKKDSWDIYSGKL